MFARRKTTVFAIGLLFVVPIIGCMIKLLQPNQIYTYEGKTVFADGIPREDVVLYDHIALPPGVYQIVLSIALDTDGTCYCTLRDTGVSAYAMQTNGENLYSAMDTTGFPVWLYESTDDLQVIASYGGQGTFATGALTIRETDLLWTRLLVLLLAGLFACLGIWIGQERRLLKDSLHRRKVFFFGGLITLLASLPYLHEGLISGADLGYHLHRIEGVMAGFVSGQIPVRIEPRWAFEHGYANAIFYCNLLLTVPALLRLLGFTIIESYSLYCIALNVATMSIAYYCFSRIYQDDNIGLCCSALYTLSIFRIYKLTITSAVGEGSAFTFLPLILYGFYRVFSEDSTEKRYQTAWIPLALGYAGLLQTHVLTCEITVLLTLIVCLLFLRKIFCLSTFLVLLKGAGMALGLSLWQLIPFLDYYLTQDMHIKHVSGRTIQERGLLPGQLFFHFWRDGQSTPLGDNGMQYSHPVGVGLILLVGLLAYGVLCYVGLPAQKTKDPRHHLAKVACMLGLLLLAMSLNVFPWDTIQRWHPVSASLVSSLQFPNRFLGWGTVFLVAVCGYILWVFGQTNRQHYHLALVVAVVGLATSGVHLIDSISAVQDHYDIYHEEGTGMGYLSGAEYLIEGTDLEALTYERPKADAGVTMLQQTKHYLHWEVQCENKNDTQAMLMIPLLSYKGYHAWDRDTGQKLPLSDSENHNVTVHLPPGYAGTVVVDFISPFYWRIGEAVSVVTALGFLIGLCSKRKNNRKEQPA